MLATAAVTAFAYLLAGTGPLASAAHPPLSAACGSGPVTIRPETSAKTRDLLASGDLVALLAAASAARDGTPEADLLGGVAAGLMLNDTEAAILLERYLASGDTTAIYFAASALAGVEMRHGRYDRAAAALRLALRPDVIATASDRDRRSTEQFMPVLEALEGIAAQSGPSIPTGETGVTRDAAELPLARVVIEGQPQPVILDTGANLSVIVRSRAAALGLRMLDAQVSVASPVAEQTPVQLAIADRLEIGGAGFRNVVFLVLPDEALTFAEGRYKIEAILGFPVLSRLGRLTFSASEAGGAMAFQPSARREDPANPPNLLVDGLTPKIIACLLPENAPIQLALDSGAQTSSLRPRFAEAFPERVAAASASTEAVGGVGGAVMRESRSIAMLELSFGPSSSVTLADVPLNEESLNQPGDHGRIGQDMLRARGGYVLDFGTMRFDLVEAAR
ncbi:retropepsin-like aspartic protease [Erythrobacter dokdonensis]|uniref:retropepsin-like aspartic protease n=1 Tax=Erythrobacter dokdonensis TaxID=328225 RepID=UPI001E582B5E|nr:retropepsin-like aspartic protease [Erythrobacter dokdonensis]